MRHNHSRHSSALGTMESLEPAINVLIRALIAPADDDEFRAQRMGLELERRLEPLAPDERARMLLALVLQRAPNALTERQLLTLLRAAKNPRPSCAICGVVLFDQGECPGCDDGQHDARTPCIACGSVGLCRTCVGSAAWLRAAAAKVRTARLAACEKLKAQMTPGELRNRTSLIAAAEARLLQVNEAVPLEGEEAFARQLEQGAYLQSLREELGRHLEVPTLLETQLELLESQARCAAGECACEQDH